MDRKTCLPLIQETMRALAPYYQEPMQAVMAETEMTGQDWFLSSLAYGLAPKPLTADIFHSVAPYNNLSGQKQRLAETAGKGFLRQVEADCYQLTDQGETAIRKLYGEVVRALNKVAPLPQENMDRLAELLARIIEATSSADAPRTKRMLQVSRRTDPGPKAAVAARIDQYLTDLVRYRDDAHISAWSGYGVDGLTWEIFSRLWQGEASNLADLAERLSNRGHAAEALAAGITALKQRGWIEESTGQLCLTKKGQELREQAEMATDDYFYLGWQALNSEEQDELYHLLLQLKEGLGEPAATPAA